MTQEQLSELKGVPTWLGLPMYPSGLPMRPDQITYGSKTLQKMYFDRVDTIAGRKVAPNFDEEKILKNFVIYHIHAPIFYNPDDPDYLQELLDKDFDEMTLDDLIMECLDYGLDPF